MKINISILLLIGFICNAIAQSNTYPSDSSLPIDESIRSGVLENGLTYYIKRTFEPEAKIKMSLNVKAGILHEEQHELNITHHIEHLAFRETTNFPSGIQGNSKLLNELGMNFRDIGGYSGQLHTGYYFEPPSKNIKAIENGILWFLDIASGLDLSKRNIDRERGVLLQESTNGGLNNNIRTTQFMNSQLFPCMSDYRTIIDHIKHFPHYDLQNFYKKWYRPDLMAISIVGNIDDIDELEEKVKRMLSRLETTGTKMPEVGCLAVYLNNDSSYLTEKPRFALVSNSSDSSNEVDNNHITYHLIFRDHLITENYNDFDDLKRERSGTFIANILNKRLKESLKEYGNTFNFYSGYKFNLFPNSLNLIIGSQLKEEKEALNKALTIVNQLRSYGIRSEELEKIKHEELKRLQSINTSTASYWEKQILNHFVYNEWLPSNKVSKEIEWVKNLSIDEINHRLHKVIPGIPEDIGIIAPKNYHANLTSERNIRNFIKQSFKRKTEAYEPQRSNPVLMHEQELNTLPLEPALELNKDFKGTQKIQFENGLTVILRSEKDRSKDSDKIYLHGFSPKGASSYPEKDYYSAMFAPYIIRHSGIGQLDKFALDEFYKINNLHSQTIPYLHLHEAGIKARGSSDELETLLQLVYLYFTQAREDKAAFEDWKKIQEKYIVRNSRRDHLDALNEITGNFVKSPIGSKRLSAIKASEFEKAHRIYNHIFGKSQNFTFILSGDFINSDVLPLLQKYLGNLPNNSVNLPGPQSARLGLSPGPVYNEVPFPDSYDSPNYSYGLKFIREKVVDDTWKEEIKLKALGNILNQLLYNLRSNDGLSLYHFGASGKYIQALDRFEVTLIVKCTPEEFGLIKEKVSIFLDNLKEGEVSTDIITMGLKDLEIAYNEMGIQKPQQLTEKLYRYYRFGQPMVSNRLVLDYIESLTIDDMVNTANDYFKEEFSYEVLMN